MQKNKKYWFIAAIIIVFIMVNPSSIQAAVYSLIKKLEEDNVPALTAYDDGEGTYTIGWGSIYNWDQKRPVQPGDQITEETANRWMMIEADQDIKAIQKMVQVPINNNQLIALASFAYNEGIPALHGSTLLSLLNAGADKQTVADQFDRWIYSKGQIVQGLINRRQVEKKLFLS